MDGIIIKKGAQKNPAQRYRVNINKEVKPENVELKTSLPLIKWETEEYAYIPKTNNWYWSVAIIAAGLVLASLLLNNILFAVLLIISGSAMILYAARRPKIISFSLTIRGLQIEKRFFPYENLKSFWLHYEPPYKKMLTIEPKKLLMPAISVPIGDTNPNVVREHLLKFMKEERREESFIQTIIRFIGF